MIPARLTGVDAFFVSTNAADNLFFARCTVCRSNGYETTVRAHGEELREKFNTFPLVKRHYVFLEVA